MYPKNSLETSANVGVLPPVAIQQPGQHKLSELLPFFLRHARYDLNLSQQTVTKYAECVNWVIRDLGDVPVELLDLTHFTLLKQKIYERGASESRVYSMVFAMRGLLKFSREAMKLSVIKDTDIRPPKRKRREVVYLTNEEIRQFTESIKIENKWNGKKPAKCLNLEGLRFRTLVEVLLGTGMRISETLSLNRDGVDWQEKEANIIGKGNKQRVIYFNDRSLEWLYKYLSSRSDVNPALFVTFGKPKRLARTDMSKIFKRQGAKSGLKKKVTPHLLRHTMATTMLHAGADIRFIQELLGHSNITTTAKYYLGTDKRVIKAAHAKFLKFVRVGGG